MKATATAKLNNLRMAPRKTRLLIGLIRGKHINDAFIQLQYSKKHASRPVMKLLRSAIANAENNAQIDVNTLRVVEARVDGGPIMYRWMPRAMGRATPIRKRTSHITIVVEGDVKEEKKTAKKATAKKQGEKRAEQKEDTPETPAAETEKKTSTKKTPSTGKTAKSAKASAAKSKKVEEK